MTDNIKECPHCKNTVGFIFGTCSQCGYNYLSMQFEIIKVRVDDLPEETVDYLIGLHENRTKKW